MRVLRDYGHATLPWSGIALAIGNFDGLHVGHQAVLHDVLAYKKAHGVPAVVMIFSPHPRRFFKADLPVLSIEPMHMRLRRFKKMGFDAVIVRRFDAAFSQMSADDFVAHDVAARLQVRYLATGSNFVFGHKRGGNAAMLQGAATRLGFAYHPVMLRTQEDTPCSSSRIREVLTAGDVARAAQLLGRDYEITGIVQHGEKRGRTIGFPTANIALPRIYAPAKGVYAVRFVAGDGRIFEQEDAMLPWMDGVANIGLRPTFGEFVHPRLEVHGFGEVGDIYGKHIRVKLLHYVRPEQRFDGLDALKAQIGRDVEGAKRWLKK